MRCDAIQTTNIRIFMDFYGFFMERSKEEGGRGGGGGDNRSRNRSNENECQERTQTKNLQLSRYRYRGRHCRFDSTRLDSIPWYKQNYVAYRYCIATIAKPWLGQD